MNQANSFFLQTLHSAQRGMWTAVERALNHLLQTEVWAREKLLPHAGKTATFSVPPFHLTLQVKSDGTVTAVSKPGGATDVTITTSLTAPKRLHVVGDADFAATIGYLTQHLRWDVEEDLSRWLGDIPARRVVASSQALSEHVRQATQQMVENLSEYFVEENPMLISREQASEFTEEVRDLRDAVERFDKRLRQRER